MTEQTDLIRISKGLKNQLDSLKVHPRQSYDEVLASLAAQNQEIESKISGLKTELDRLQTDRFKAGPSSPEFERLSKEIREKLDQIHDLEAYRLFAERKITVAEEAEKQKVLQAEKERKERIIKFLEKNPPRCQACLKRDHMRLAVDGFGKPLLQPQLPGGFADGMASKDVRWAIRYHCYRRGCDTAQNVWPDEDRYLSNGSRDDEFPIKVKEADE